jgi:hypothetical protein
MREWELSIHGSSILYRLESLHALHGYDKRLFIIFPIPYTLHYLHARVRE